MAAALGGAPVAEAAHAARPPARAAVREAMCLLSATDEPVKVFVGEAHYEPENLPLIADVLTSALGKGCDDPEARKRTVSFWREMGIGDWEGPHAAAEHMDTVADARLAHWGDRRSNADLIATEILRDVPAAQTDLNAFKSAVRDKRLTPRLMSFVNAKRSDMTAAIKDPADVSVASVGFAHAVAEPSALRKGRFQLLWLADHTPDAAPQNYSHLSGRVMRERFDGFNRAQQAGQSVFVCSTRTLHEYSGVDARLSRARLLDFFPAKGQVVLEVPWQYGNVTIVAPRARSEELQAFAQRHDGVLMRGGADDDEGSNDRSEL